MRCSVSTFFLLVLAVSATSPVVPVIAMQDDGSESRTTPVEKLDVIFGATLELSSAGGDGGSTALLHPTAWGQFPLTDWAVLYTRIPWYFRVDASETYGQIVQSSVGDPAIGLGLIGATASDRALVSIYVSIPVSLKSDYALANNVLAPGRGSYVLGVGCALRRIADPLVLFLSGNYEIELPRSVQFGTVWRPVLLEIAVGVTEVLNENFALSIEMHQSIASGPIPLRTPFWSDFRCGTFVRVSGALSIKESTVSVSYQSIEAGGNGTSLIVIEYSQSFPKKE